MASQRVRHDGTTITDSSLTRCCIFHRLRVCGDLRPGTLVVPFFQKHLPTLRLCLILVILELSQTLHQSKDYNSKAQGMGDIF